MTIDLNCDLGEGEPVEVTEALMRSITSCNIACGGHAGDERSMRETVALAQHYGVAIGAHPSFADRVGFGRRVMPIDASGLRALLAEQVGRFDVPLHHIKLHGALYHVVEADDTLARAYADFAGDLPVIALPNGAVARHAKRIIREFFADRAYRDDGTLVPRSQPDAVLSNVEEICGRVLQAASQFDTICVHGDTPHSAQLAAKIRKSLEAAGITVQVW